MSKTMEYKIVEAASKYKLTDKVNGFMLQGWRPYGIPFLLMVIINQEKEQN